MTEIKTAQAWGHRSSPSALLNHAGRKSEMFNIPYVIVYGLTEAEVHEAAALLAKSREVCEWYLSENQHGEYDYCASLCDAEYQMRMPTFCPSCGRKVAVLEKNLAKLTDKLAMVEQESEQRLSAIISYSDQLLAMKEKYEPASQSEPHPDGCFSSYMNDVQDCETDGHYSCKDCKRNSRIAAQRGEVEK